ncbi:hypothetical protein [Angustibacter aerolatus]
MSYNSSAQIYVTNNTGGTATVHLSHQYSDDGTQQGTWTVPDGQNAGPLSAGFNTGFMRTGADWWWIGLEVADGPQAGSYASDGSADDPGKMCMLQSQDDGRTLTFSVDTTTLVMTELSGSCSTSLSPA